jgi:hypothetical protein
MINSNPNFPANKGVAQGERLTAHGKIYLMPEILNFRSVENTQLGKLN